MDDATFQKQLAHDAMYCYLCDYEMTGARVPVGLGIVIDGETRFLYAHKLCCEQFYMDMSIAQLPIPDALKAYRTERLKRD